MEIFQDQLNQHRPFFRAAALHAWYRLSQGVPIHPVAHARERGLDPDKFELLRRVLEYEGLLCLEAGLWAPNSPPPPAPPLQGWGLLAQVIQGAEPLSMEGPTTARYFEHLDQLARGRAAALAAAIELPPGAQVADIGCGRGSYGAAFAAQGAEVLFVDLAEALAVAKPPGPSLAHDIEAAPLPQRFELIIAANLLHLYGPRRAQKIVQQVRASLLPGGRLIIKDLAYSPTAPTPLPLYFSLNMALYTQDGCVHSDGQIEDWLNAAELDILHEDSARLRSCEEELLVCAQLREPTTHR